MNSSFGHFIIKSASNKHVHTKLTKAIHKKTCFQDLILIININWCMLLIAQSHAVMAQNLLNLTRNTTS